jgi:hypothetical protein
MARQFIIKFSKLFFRSRAVRVDRQMILMSNPQGCKRVWNTNIHRHTALHTRKEGKQALKRKTQNCGNVVFNMDRKALCSVSGVLSPRAAYRAHVFLVAGTGAVQKGASGEICRGPHYTGAPNGLHLVPNICHLAS